MHKPSVWYLRFVLNFLTTGLLHRRRISRVLWVAFVNLMRRGLDAVTEDSGWDDSGNVACAQFWVGKQPRGMIWVVGAWTFKIPLSNGLKFLECAGLDVGPLKVGMCFALHLVCITADGLDVGPVLPCEGLGDEDK
jgi:hypothetical protein